MSSGERGRGGPLTKDTRGENSLEKILFSQFQIANMSFVRISILPHHAENNMSQQYQQQLDQHKSPVQEILQ